MRFLDQLLKEAASMTAEDMPQDKAPSGELALGERLLKDGIVPEDVRRWYHFFTKKALAINPQKVAIQHEAEMLDAKGELTPEKKHELQAALNRLQNQLDLIERLFWLGVKEAVPEAYDVKRLALRKGWQVVEEPEPEPEFSMPRGLIGALLLSSLLGPCDDPTCQCHGHGHSRGKSGGRKGSKGAKAPAAAPQPAEPKN